MEKRELFQNLPIIFARIIERWEEHGAQVVEAAKKIETGKDDLGRINIDQVMEAAGIKNPDRARALMTSLGGFVPDGGKYEEATTWEFNPRILK